MLTHPWQDLLSSSMPGFNMNLLNSEESAGSITGYLVLSVTGAFLIPLPSRRIPSTRIGFKGANLLL